MTKLTHLVGFFVLIVISQYDAKRNFSVELMDLNCSISDKSFIKSFNCYLYGRKVFYHEVEFYKDLHEMTFKFCLNVIGRNKIRVNLLTTNVDTCETLEKNTLYVTRNYTIVDDDYPPLVPIVDWEITIDVISGKKSRGSITANGRVRKV
ncbi:uncharacterized protein LOC142235824 [Haematobia irritans]|uniref:uncharacterized protein LOC142235824 n=1 Tax=Haematobia irritans TaxID=7368 RepID=UPI003F501768